MPIHPEPDFRILRNHAREPLLVYDGVESPRIVVPQADDTGAPMHVELGLAAAWNWRLYYTDADLAKLASLLEFRLGFRLQREIALNAALTLPVAVSPSWKEGSEYSVCFCYDELSPQHFKFWLIGVLIRPMHEQEHQLRIRQVRSLR